MSDRFVETQSLSFEVDTGDSTLSSHTGKKIWYIPPKSDGTEGLLTNKLSVTGTSVANDKGVLTVNRGTPITLIRGVYSFWSESEDGSQHRVSPAFGLVVEALGTIR